MLFRKQEIFVLCRIADTSTSPKPNRYRDFPGWIKLILIRKVTDIASVGIESKNDPKRFEKAFEDMPREAWHVFEDPAECQKLIEQVISADP